MLVLDRIKPGPVPNRPDFWKLAHYLSLAALGAVYLWLGNGQWFFYDEWTLLLDESQWKVFEPHNGHLSFGLVAAFSLMRAVFGLGSYWPFFSLVLVAHLAAVHLIWQVLVRQRTAPIVAFVAPVIFGLLGVGAENTLWAFQFAFIAPIPLGLAAMLIANRPFVSWRRVVLITLILGLALSFASTAIPIIFAALGLVLSRAGWKKACVIAVAIGLPYLAWRVRFHAGESTTGFEAHTAEQFFIDVPNYILHSFVDGLSKVAPVEVISAAIICLVFTFALHRSTRLAFAEWPLRYFLFIGAVVFSALTAVSRVGYGIDGASSGRYVYVLAALTVPAAAFSIGQFCLRGRAALAVALAGTILLLGFNTTTLYTAAHEQSAIEELSKRQFAAAESFADDQSIASDSYPIPVLAPQLTISNVRELAPKLALPRNYADPGALLSVRTSLELSSSPIAENSPCLEPASNSITFPTGRGDDGAFRSSAQEDITVTVTAIQGKWSSAYTSLRIGPGAQNLRGLEDVNITLSSSSNDLCRISFNSN